VMPEKCFFRKGSNIVDLPTETAATLPANAKSMRDVLANGTILTHAENYSAFGHVLRAGRRPSRETDRRASRPPLLLRRKNLGKPWPTIRVGNLFLRAGGP